MPETLNDILRDYEPTTPSPAGSTLDDALADADAAATLGPLVDQALSSGASEDLFNLLALSPDRERAWLQRRLAQDQQAVPVLQAFEAFMQDPRARQNYAMEMAQRSARATAGPDDSGDRTANRQFLLTDMFRTRLGLPTLAAQSDASLRGARPLPSAETYFAGGAARGAADIGNALMGASPDRIRRTNEAFAQLFPESGGVTGQTAFSIGQMLPSLLPAMRGGQAAGALAARLGAGARGQAAAAAGGMNAVMTAPQVPVDYVALRDKGVSARDALGASLGQAAAETGISAAFGMSGLERLLRTPAGQQTMRSAVSGVVRGAGEEIPEELLQQAVNNARDYMIDNPQAPASEAIQAAVTDPRYRESYQVAGLAASVMGGGASAAQAGVGGLADAAAADQAIADQRARTLADAPAPAPAPVQAQPEPEQAAPEPEPVPTLGEAAAAASSRAAAGGVEQPAATPEPGATPEPTGLPEPVQQYLNTVPEQFRDAAEQVAVAQVESGETDTDAVIRNAQQIVAIREQRAARAAPVTAPEPVAGPAFTTQAPAETTPDRRRAELEDELADMENGITEADEDRIAEIRQELGQEVTQAEEAAAPAPVAASRAQALSGRERTFEQDFERTATTEQRLVGERQNTPSVASRNNPEFRIFRQADGQYVVGVTDPTKEGRTTRPPFAPVMRGKRGSAPVARNTEQRASAPRFATVFDAEQFVSDVAYRQRQGQERRGAPQTEETRSQAQELLADRGEGATASASKDLGVIRDEEDRAHDAVVQELMRARAAREPGVEATEPAGLEPEAEPSVELNERMTKILTFLSDAAGKGVTVRGDLANRRLILNGRPFAVTVEDADAVNALIRQGLLRERSTADGGVQLFVTGRGREAVEFDPGQFPDRGGLTDADTALRTGNFGLGPAQTLRTEPGDIVALASIQTSLAEALGVAIRSGGFRQNALGVFKKGWSIARVKRAGDFGVAVHEMGHRVWYWLKLQGKMTRAADAELIQLALRDKLVPRQNPNWNKAQTARWRRKAVREGAAQFALEWLRDPLAAATLPEFHRIWTTALTDAGAMPVFIRAREQLDSYRLANGKQRIDVFVAEQQFQRNRSVREWLRHLYTTIFDSEYFLKLAVEDIAGDQDVDIVDDAYIHAQLAKGNLDQAADALVGRGLPTEDGGFMSYKKALEPVKARIRDFQTYGVARRVLELTDPARPGGPLDVGITREDAIEAVTMLDGEPGFRQAFDDLQVFNQALRDFMVREGLITAENAEKMRILHQNYIPFQRVLDGVGARPQFQRVSTGTGKRAPVFKIKGSKRQIRNPLEVYVQNVITTFQAAGRNRTADAMVRLAAKNLNEAGDIGKWFDIVPPEIVGASGGMSAADTKRIRQNLIDQGLSEDQADVVMSESGASAVTVFAADGGQALARTLNKDGSNLLKVLPTDDTVEALNKAGIKNAEVGKPLFLSINDPDLFQAFQGLGLVQFDLATRIARTGTSLLRMGATTLNPDFFVRNFLRDTLTAVFQTESRFAPLRLIPSTVRAAVQATTRSDGWWNYLASGAGNSMFFGATAKDAIDASGLWRGSHLAKMWHYAKSPLLFTERVGGMFEATTRLAEYNRVYEDAIADGLDARRATMKAALAARRVTVDFARAGRGARLINLYVPFFNAALQGTDITIRTMIKHPVRSAAFVGMMYGISVIQQALLDEYELDDEYDEHPDWERDNFWLLPAPSAITEETGLKFVRVPKPPGLWAALASGSERSLRQIRQDDPRAWKGFVANAVSQVQPVGFDPDAPLAAVLGSLTPQAILPMVELATNYDFFRKNNIVPKWTQDRLEYHQYGYSDHEVVKAMGRYLNRSPAMIEHVITGYTAGLGTMALDGADAIAAGDRPSADHWLTKVPVARGLLSRNPGLGAMTMVEFYEVTDEVRKAAGSAQFLTREGRVDPKLREELVAYMKTNGFDVAMADVFMGAARAHAAARVRLRSIELATDMNVVEKRAAMDQVYEQLYDQAGRVLDVWYREKAKR